MKTIIALLLLASTANAQVYVEWVACPNGVCQPRYYAPPQQYPNQWQPIRNPEVHPDGIETPPVGAPGTPDFSPQPPAKELPTPPQPSNPPLANPAPAAGCDCKGKWEALEKERTELKSLVAKLEVSISAQQETIVALQQNNQQHQSGATVADVLAELDKRPLPRIRIVDPQGKYTTPYVDVRAGYDTDLIIDQRYSVPAQ